MECCLLSLLYIVLGDQHQSEEYKLHQDNLTAISTIKEPHKLNQYFLLCPGKKMSYKKFT